MSKTPRPWHPNLISPLLVGGRDLVCRDFRQSPRSAEGPSGGRVRRDDWNRHEAGPLIGCLAKVDCRGVVRPVIRRVRQSEPAAVCHSWC